MVLEDLSLQLGIPIWAIIVLLIWSLVWKGFALWKAVKNRQLIWFIAILIINTLGVLEILYIFVFSKLEYNKKKKKK